MYHKIIGTENQEFLQVPNRYHFQGKERSAILICNIKDILELFPVYTFRIYATIM